MSIDLRVTLSREAAAITDHDAVSRASAVHRRVRRTRRRRAAVGVLAVVAVVVAVACGSALVMRPTTSRVPAEVVGRPLPPTTTSLGATYRLEDVATAGGGSLDVTLAAADAPRLVRWASRSARGRLVLSGSVASPPWTTSAGGFGTFVVVPAGERATLRLRQVESPRRGDVALAVYRFSRPSPGLTAHGVTFRRYDGSAHLVGAAIGREGGSEATSVLPRSWQGTGSVRVMCDAPRAFRARVMTDDGSDGTPSSVIGTVACDPGAIPSGWSTGIDAGEASSVSFSTHDGLSASSRRLRVQLVDAAGRAVDGEPGVRVAAAIYDPPLGGTAMPDALDVDGHHWEATTRAASRRQSFETTTTDPGRLLVRWNVPTVPGGGTVRVATKAFPVSGASSDGNGRTFGLAQVDVGEGAAILVRLRVYPDYSPIVRLGVYRLAD